MKENTTNQPASGINKPYIIGVSILTFIFPALATIIGHRQGNNTAMFALFCKWFIFSAVRIRLFIAGLRQTITPEFTAKQIFHIDNPDCLPIVRELGFANICFGLVGLISLFKPEWRMVSAFASGVYYGLAGIMHLIKKPAGANEQFALWTDLIIFLILVAYVSRYL
ncbi:MAG TPA: DUF6790 family protein [Puia sp.]|nr:DUF6790 family protein [Puia sp.]